MAMKANDAPRRLYARKGRPFVNFQGTFWGPPKSMEESAMDMEALVTCEASEDGKTVTVVQRKPKKKGVTETWVPVKIGS